MAHWTSSLRRWSRLGCAPVCAMRSPTATVMKGPRRALRRTCALSGACERSAGNVPRGAGYWRHPSGYTPLSLCRTGLWSTLWPRRRQGTGFHIHVAEDGADEEDSLQRYGLRVAERLERKRVLGQMTLAAHCVHVDAGEMTALARTGTKVSHQPRSNMNNAVGTAPVQALLDAGVIVGLGNDGFSNNMFAEMKAAYLAHKAATRDPRAMPGDTVIRLG
ncbi:MAG: hypothetical protein C4310_13570, partial [Chloroflexota bacterium]